MSKPANSKIVQYILLCRTIRISYLLFALVFVLNACAMEGDNQKHKSGTQRLESKPIIDQTPKKKPSSQKGNNKTEQLFPESTGIERENILDDNNGQVVSLETDFTNFKKRLLGLDVDEVVGLLGLPAFRRNETPMEIWQYRTLACVVDVFLSESDGILEVDYVETRGRDKRQVDEKTCFESVLKNISAKF